MTSLKTKESISDSKMPSEVEIIYKYFPGLSPLQKEQFEKLGVLYQDWNEKINVVSRKDVENLYPHHVLHSLGIAKHIQFPDKAKILDVGTGGGFPGIPLAILFPNAQFHLVDSIRKKIWVVEAVVYELDLKNVTYEHIRAEKVKDRFDFIVSRAVAQMRMFYAFVKDKASQRHSMEWNTGIYYLKGGDLTKELSQFKRTYQLSDLSDHFDEDFFQTKKVLYVPM